MNFTSVGSGSQSTHTISYGYCPSVLLELRLEQIATSAHQILKLQLYLLLFLGGKPEVESSKETQNSNFRLDNT